MSALASPSPNDVTMTPSDVAPVPYRHWRIDRDPDGLHWLWFDKASESTNTFSTDAMEELRAIVDKFSSATAAERPRAMVVLSAKESGFIAGADVREFMKISTPEEAHALVGRGYDTFNAFAALPFPTLALIKGFCMGGGLELSLACTYRIAVDDPSTRMALPEVMLGIVPAWHGIEWLPKKIGPAAALDLMLTGKSIDAGRAKKMGLADQSVPLRIFENTARVVTLEAKPRRELPFMQRMMLGPLRGFVVSQAKKQVAKRARQEHYPAPYAILDLWQKHDGNPFIEPDAPYSINALFEIGRAHV